MSSAPELSRIVHGSWDEDSCPDYEAQAAAAEILAIAEADVDATIAAALDDSDHRVQAVARTLQRMREES